MYMKIGNEYADGELQLLSELLFLLDKKITEIIELMATSSDPESDGLTDRGEYFIGVGFTAIQQYLTDTLTLTGISKAKAFDLGPTYSNNLTYVAVINAAANWWKHSSEWFPSGSDRKDALSTEQIISAVTDSESYQLSSVLAELLTPSEITLSALLPRLEAWREDVDRTRSSE